MLKCFGGFILLPGQRMVLLLLRAHDANIKEGKVNIIAIFPNRFILNCLFKNTLVLDKNQPSSMFLTILLQPPGLLINSYI
jgi:hypothetical protein